LWQTKQSPEQSGQSMATAVDTQMAVGANR
jgi:hypothetical protein